MGTHMLKAVIRASFKLCPDDIFIVMFILCNVVKIKVPLLRFDLLANQQNAQRVIVMQNSAAIIVKSNFHYISANNAHNCTNKVSRVRDN